MAQRLSSAELTKLGESRETWCAVEWKKEQDWCRTQRSHFPQQFPKLYCSQYYKCITVLCKTF
ncbi:hypothetical protein KUTeg_014188 [Tegillarca granosa]|uniref:Uncharacterized protein n=1 Tax=Tegillarca granosa TaxID=220873 RepID=A0ABQ9EW89_TEGGR|nr:hypothetical protein KUTeg_014188 [Tegillarca granosa]